ncbi:MAG: hypothetical protein CMF76_10350 [Maricaulis sp.]|nr:hypothetical protein [Maricaulis sp.]
MVAPAVAGSGTIRVGGSTFGQNSSNGRIRVEAFSHLATYNYLPVASASVARPGPVFLPATAPRIRATQIVLQGGATVPVPANPAGSYVMPDAVVDTIDPITVNVMAENVPLTGSTIELRVTSDNGGTMVLTTSTLTGTQASSTASLGPFSLPSGYSRFSLTITFDPQ